MQYRFAFALIFVPENIYSDQWELQCTTAKLAAFLWAHIYINKASNPIILGVKWKPLISAFQWCHWIWDLDWNCLRYVRKHDSNLDIETAQNDWLLIHFKHNFLNCFCIKWPFSCAHMKAENLRISKLSLITRMGASKLNLWAIKY